MISVVEYFSGGQRVKHTVTKDENGPETVDEFLDRARAEHAVFIENNPRD